MISLPLEQGYGSEEIWTRVAESLTGWLAGQGAPARDAIVLLPFAQALAPARRAFTRLGGWAPRLETTHSLAAALGPNHFAQPGQISFDAAVDALSATQLLAEQSWAQELRRSDERAYRVAVARLVELAHALLYASASVAPSAREAFWNQAREVLGVNPGPAGIERALSLVAVEWAAADGRIPPTDALFGLQAGAWIAIQAGGADPLADALLGAVSVPALKLIADVDLDAALPLGRVEQVGCAEFEDLAQCSAAAVLQHLIEGRGPVALVAQDRVLVRRIRALLERQGVTVGDETGWTLATTPPAAELMALLRAAARGASLDDLLAWLKSRTAQELREACGADAVDLLEARCRARGWRSLQALDIASLPVPAARLWERAKTVLAHLQAGASRRSLLSWIQGLQGALRAAQGFDALREHEAGEKVLDVLWLTRSPWPGSAHEEVLQQAVLTESEFRDWLSDTLEGEQFAAETAEAPQVVVTPLARVILRPFNAVVLPGADTQGLGLSARLPALISDAQATAIGLPDLDSQRQAAAFAFAQLLRAPALTLLRRTAVGAEPLAPSPLVERLNLALARAHLPPLPEWRDARLSQAIEPDTPARAAAVAPGLLPARLSASAVESLRQCPYQFFGRVLLGLREQEELEGELEKRDYGTWLHDVLQAFHEGRPNELDDEAWLRECARQQTEKHGLAAEEFLPYEASFERFVPRYLDWLQATEAVDQRFEAGEIERSVMPWSDAPLAGLQLQGRIDRIDTSPEGHVLIDYKTSSVDRLKSMVKQPLEDTQLAVYAAFMAEDGARLKARYLALDDGKGLAEIEHPDAADTAQALIDGLGEDLRQLHAGAPLPALGEGTACDYCAMRGLCRKDDWQ
ncbi:PD-(D/E)XK nuclease family protein [Burkholderiaceae bacterium UC74_6]